MDPGLSTEAAIVVADQRAMPPVPTGKRRRQKECGDVLAGTEDTRETGTAPSRSWANRAVAAAAVLFIGAMAFAGASAQPYLADRAVVDTKYEIARTAADAITSLWTYSPDSMESLPNRSAKFLGGDLQTQYRKYVDAIAPTNRQAQVTNNTDVMGTAVESLNGSDASAIVYTNTTSTSPLSANVPSLRYLSYRLEMRHQEARWLVIRMTTVTSLDLMTQVRD